MAKRAGLEIGIGILALLAAFLAFSMGVLFYETGGMIAEFRSFVAETDGDNAVSEGPVREEAVGKMVEKWKRRFLSASLVGLLGIIATGLLLSLRYLSRSPDDDPAIPLDIILPRTHPEKPDTDDPYRKMFEVMHQVDELDDDELLPADSLDDEPGDDLYPAIIRPNGDGMLAGSYSRMVEALQKINDLEKKHSEELSDANDRLAAEISERERAEKEIRHLSRQLINSTEEAQKKLAQDLHDEFGQTLAALHMGVENLWNSIPYEMEEQKRNINELIDLIEQLGDKIRSISSDLRPDLLDDLGLIPTLEWYIKEFTAQRSDIWVDFSAAGFKRRLEPDTELVLYRIFQESLNNVVKHSRAKNVEVILTHNYPKAILMIRDDGLGFDTSRRSSGIGLIGMRERVVSVNGTVDIRSEKGKGTTVRVEIPVPQKGEDNGQD